MALINCPECGKEISDTAKNCINCGYVLKEESNTAQPQTVIIAPQKGMSAKKSLNVGITILLSITAWSFLTFVIGCIFNGDFVVPISDSSNLNSLISWMSIPTVISIVMAILMYSVPKFRNTWFKILYVLLSISAMPLSLIVAVLTVPIGIAYVVGVVLIIKSIFIKD